MTNTEKVCPRVLIKTWNFWYCCVWSRGSLLQDLYILIIDVTFNWIKGFLSSTKICLLDSNQAMGLSCKPDRLWDNGGIPSRYHLSPQAIELCFYGILCSSTTGVALSMSGVNHHGEPVTLTNGEDLLDESCQWDKLLFQVVCSTSLTAWPLYFWLCSLGTENTVGGKRHSPLQQGGILVVA